MLLNQKAANIYQTFQSFLITNYLRPGRRHIGSGNAYQKPHCLSYNGRIRQH